MTSWVTIAMPSPANARRPPEWSKWWWVLTTYRIGFDGTSLRVSARTASARWSLSGPSTTITWSFISITTLWCVPPVRYQTPSATIWVATVE